MMRASTKMPGGRREVLAVGHREARVDLAVERHDEGALGRAGDLPDDGLAAPHEHLHDDARRARRKARARSSGRAFRGLDAHEDDVAVERAAEGRHGHVGDARLARQQKGPALAADRERAGLKSRELDARELLALDAHDLAPALEVGDRRAERVLAGGIGFGAEDAVREVGEREDARAAGCGSASRIALFRSRLFILGGIWCERGDSNPHSR